jgi:hypothetical protein
MDYNIFTPLIPFGLGILLKIFLDFNLALYVVKYLYWIPVRSIFRTKPEIIAGNWTQIWENNTSEKYEPEQARQSKIRLKQFGKYVYGEFRSNNDEEYYLFGEIIGKNIIGKWGDKKSNLGYFGSYELLIVDSQHIQGIWLGHSNYRPDQINHNKWTMTR